MWKTSRKHKHLMALHPIRAIKRAVWEVFFFVADAKCCITFWNISCEECIIHPIFASAMQVEGHSFFFDMNSLLGVLLISLQIYPGTSGMFYALNYSSLRYIRCCFSCNITFARCSLTLRSNSTPNWRHRLSLRNVPPSPRDNNFFKSLK